jgi:hypothetical protein
MGLYYRIILKSSRPGLLALAIVRGLVLPIVSLTLGQLLVGPE